MLYLCLSLFPHLFKCCFNSPPSFFSLWSLYISISFWEEERWESALSISSKLQKLKTFIIFVHHLISSDQQITQYTHYPQVIHFFLLSRRQLKSLLMRVKQESEKASLKLNIQKTKIMASSLVTSWLIDGEKGETVTDFIFFAF